MERRALIAVVISVVILIVYQEFVIKRFFGPQSAPVEPERTTVAPPTGVRGAVAENPAAPPAAAPPAAPPSAAMEPIVGSDVVVDTDLYRALFTTAGARLKSLELKRYRATVAADSPPLQMVLFPVQNRLPLGLSLANKQQQLDDAGVLYRADRSSVTLGAGQTGEVTFVGELGGTTLRKRVAVHGDSYLWEIDAEAANVPPAYTEMALSWDEGVNPLGPKAAEVVFDQIVVLQDNKLQHEAFAKIDAGTLLTGNIGWMAFSGRYFLAALVPEADATNPLAVWAKHSEPLVEAQLRLPPGQFSTRAELYVGPKDIDTLEAAGHGLRRAVDLGFFSFIALPMLQGLRLLHRVTGNYGVAIIIVTVLVKVIFFPLTKKSFESMRQMQKLQPEMQKLKERLKDKPDEMNKEVMELYRRHKVNPLGGCLPMVLQLPVLFGLYSALQNAIELRHAPFIGWITDLSAPDRLGALQLPFVDHPGIPVMTLAMGVSMFVQQWMTPSAADPQQQRIMMIMPAMMTFMFMNFPAGLTLYWLVNNLLTIGQQYMMTRQRQ